MLLWASALAFVLMTVVRVDHKCVVQVPMGKALVWQTCGGSDEVCWNDSEISAAFGAPADASDAMLPDLYEPRQPDLFEDLDFFLTAASSEPQTPLLMS